MSMSKMCIGSMIKIIRQYDNDNKKDAKKL